MSKIVRLTSYYKSGNTWMRVVWTSYIRNGDTPADINKLGAGPIASVRLWLDEWTGIETSALNDNII